VYLKKIEISGFKSFAQKTTLEFLSSCNFKDGDKICGITAIVGPNGSGKSNVADAIRWTMGEQSMKNLRGKKSEDVIFAGSGKKARLGSAQVTLYFDNSDKKIPLEFEDVSITRKLFRSGDSEYLINGSRTRLIDVIDLLAKAGVGKESYCVLNQGMSDAVLNATPLERRAVLEDAAGVKQYQIKKERAIRKLESTQNNLGRVGDLIKEIEPHLRMLKRQADKAQKGKELAHELKEKQIKLFSYLWHTFQKERAGLSLEKNDMGAKMMNVQREVDKITDELNKESKEVQNFQKLEALERKRDELRVQLNSLEKELVIAEGRLEIEKEKVIQTEMIEHIPVDLGYVRERLEKIRGDQEKLIERLAKVESLEEIQDLKEFARAIQQELYDLYQTAGKENIEVKKDLSSEAKAHSEKIQELSVKCDEARKKIDLHRKEVEKAESEIRAEAERTKKMRDKFFELERLMRTKQDELGKLKDQFNESKINLAKVEVREEDLTSEIKEQLKVNPDELKYGGEGCDRHQLEHEISKIKIQLEQAGGIDPLIVDEYEETKKRFEFLNQESEDLKNALKSCREVIKEMDAKIKDVFDSAFEKINKEFIKYFRIIFGGGNAHLVKSKIKSRKIKEDDLEAAEGDLAREIPQGGSEEVAISQGEEEIGIDISACPPGKKIANLNMLSGGERSLTSLALLFAIISHNPPPFAVLDEVEAALDEANSRRFGRIIQELSSNTQFVIITHNRETMRQASLLYGVTMGEDGISKLLSVKLDQVGQGGKISGV
jgi:chromosome segregation ATPase